MKSCKIAANAKMYYELLVKDFPPERVDEKYRGEDRIIWLKHACWLALHIPCLLLEGEIGKAKRWQSCLHGYLQMGGYYSVEDNQIHSMPEGAIYQRNG